jgi:hypothetical protein
MDKSWKNFAKNIQAICTKHKSKIKDGKELIKSKELLNFIRDYTKFRMKCDVSHLLGGYNLDQDINKRNLFNDIETLLKDTFNLTNSNKDIKNG